MSIQKRMIILASGTLLFFAGLCFGENLIYDARFFRAAEMVNKVTSDSAYVHLLLREDKEFDVKLIYGAKPDLSTSRTIIFYRRSKDKMYIPDFEPIGSELFKTKVFYREFKDGLNIPLMGLKEAERFYYQLYCKEKGSWWQPVMPIRSFTTLKSDLSKGDELRAIIFGDLHLFDDANLGKRIVKDEKWQKLRLNGDYVNVFLERLFENPYWTPEPGSEESKLMNGFCWAKAIKQIIREKDPFDFLFDLGDLTGIGSNYKWDGLGLSEEYAAKDYETISKILWERTRRIYSGLSPDLPIYLVLGNHDGEENWNPAKFAAREWRKKVFPLPGVDGNYYAFTWGKKPDGSDGALFVVLDVCSYSGRDGHSPKTLEEWTLGEEQFQWLEKVLKESQARYKFILFHHVLGGWPTGPGIQGEGAYGQGPLFTQEDYLLVGANPDKIEQIKITNLARKYNVNMFIYGHDHMFHLREISKSAKGEEMYALCVGSPKYQHEKIWWGAPLWQLFYGYAYTTPIPPFYGVPGYTTLDITKDYIEVKFTCSAYAPCPQLNNYYAQPGDVLYSKKLYFSN